MVDKIRPLINGSTGRMKSSHGHTSCGASKLSPILSMRRLAIVDVEQVYCPVCGDMVYVLHPVSTSYRAMMIEVFKEIHEGCLSRRLD